MKFAIVGDVELEDCSNTATKYGVGAFGGVDCDLRGGGGGGGGDFMRCGGGGGGGRFVVGLYVW